MTGHELLAQIPAEGATQFLGAFLGAALGHRLSVRMVRRLVRPLDLRVRAIEHFLSTHFHWKRAP